MRESVTSEATSSRSFSVWARALSIHFCLPVSISSRVRQVAMTVMGVFNSWLASVTNCFCRWLAFTTGSMARLENSTTSTETSATHTAMAPRDSAAVRNADCRSLLQSRNTAR